MKLNENFLTFFIINAKLVTSKHMTRCGGSLGGGGRGMDALDPWEADRVQQTKSVQKEKQERGFTPLYQRKLLCVYYLTDSSQ